MSSAGLSLVPAGDASVAPFFKMHPENPFSTEAFFNARRRLGQAVYVLSGHYESGAVSCGVFITQGKLHRRLEIVSAPHVPSKSVFWQSLLDLCSRHGITQLEVNTFGSAPDTIVPTIGRNTVVRRRAEYVLELEGGDARISSNHRRNIKKAQKAGVQIQRNYSLDSLAQHLKLIGASLGRRRDRGEQVSEVVDSRGLEALLETKAGELFQAVQSGAVLSSVLVLRSERCGYYQSAGTSPEGMALGASHLLIAGVASALRDEGVHQFNLGGAPDGSTLARFKEGFGASVVRLQSIECQTGPQWKHRVAHLGRALQRNPKSLLAPFLIERIRMVIYRDDLRKVYNQAERPGLTFASLSADELLAIQTEDSSFTDRQRVRLARFGEGCAFGVFVNGVLGHVSWLLPADVMMHDQPRVIPIRYGEMEITACETLPSFRGQGIYPFAIINLLSVAQKSGARCVYMKVAEMNSASQAGIEKVGFRRLGTADVITHKLTGRHIVLRRLSSN